MFHQDGWKNSYAVREIAPAKKTDWKPLRSFMLNYYAVYTDYSNPEEYLYRSQTDKALENSPNIGEFQYCACDFKRCKLNAAAANHFCGFCLKRMHGLCLIEDGTWGVCRQCSLVKTTTRRPIVDPGDTSTPKTPHIEEVVPVPTSTAKVVQPSTTRKPRKKPINVAIEPVFPDDDGAMDDVEVPDTLPGLSKFTYPKYFIILNVTK